MTIARRDLFKHMYIVHKGLVLLHSPVCLGVQLRSGEDLDPDQDLDWRKVLGHFLGASSISAGTRGATC